MRVSIVLFLRISVSTGLITLLITTINWDQVFDIVANINLQILTPLLCLIALSYLLSAVRWHLLAPEIPLIRLLMFTIMGAYYNVVAPGQFAGELWKIFRITQGQIDKIRITTSVLLDKIAGLAGQVGVSAGAIFVSSSVFPEAINFFVYVSAAVMLIIIWILRANILGKIFTISRSNKILSWLKFKSIFAYIKSTSDSWNRFDMAPRITVLAIILGAMVHLCNASMYYLLGPTMGILIPLVDWIWISSLVSILLLLPITIAGIGLREGALVVCLSWFHVSAASATALSLTLFSLYVCTIIPGLILDLLVRPVTSKSIMVK